MKLFGIWGAFQNDIEGISLDFHLQKNVNIEEARKLLVGSVEELLHRINNDVGIRPFLHNYPFTNNNLWFSIGFKDKNNKFVLPPNIAMASLILGKISYGLEDLKEPLLFDEIHEETYEEALKIYQSEKL